MIDAKGYRANVGIILGNDEGKVFWARRYGQDAWQFPQGGIKENETPLEAMYRELREETGLQPSHVRLVGQTSNWLRYRIPRHLLRHRSQPLCIGQKQIWFRLQLIGCEDDVDLLSSGTPEFDTWCWVDYWTPLREIVFFKRKVYQQALRQLENCVVIEV